RVPGREPVAGRSWAGLKAVPYSRFAVVRIAHLLRGTLFRPSPTVDLPSSVLLICCAGRSLGRPLQSIAVVRIAHLLWGTLFRPSPTVDFPSFRIVHLL